ncbi:hypothetical protein E2562_018397 [Oryza meyeriana var. granulata]|uniref:DUF632 domain-containing protein n=1 Tax=Oryza meyeriana var. granulata TaxID=110450 RepID=A0A6G1D5B0_9ORYZ|nr:hypothetical protein E2562_018397 [Oryza meyeriana var. granulata]
MASASSQDPTGTPPLDHFDQIHPGENLFPLQDKNKSGQYFDKVDDLIRCREEGIPELEEEGERTPSNEEDDFAESKDDFANEDEENFAESKDDFRSPSIETLVPMSNNNNDVSDKNSSTDKAPEHHGYGGRMSLFLKVNSAICRRYDEKCKQLRDQESRGKNQIHVDFIRATVKDLHSRILVAIQKINFISKNIEDIRDKDLQPQLDELIRSLTRMWETMLGCHQLQHAIMKLVSSKSSVKLSFQSESQYQDALLLSAKLSKLCSDFQNWVASHKTYLSSLNLWLHKCMKPLKKRKSSRKQNVVDVSLTECAVAPIFTTCEIWIKFIDDLPTNQLVKAIEDLIADVGNSLPHQEQLLNGETGGGILRNNAPSDLQSSLMAFLEKLEAFSAVSLQKYIDLQKNIDEAKERFSRDD